MSFTHLHVHSHYSLLDGLGKIDELVSRAAALGMDALALTDHGNLYGAIEFYQKARTAGIKPIIGSELYIAAGDMRDKRPGIDDKRWHLTVLAASNEGYQNLLQLVTKAHLEGFYYKPRVDKACLREHAQGLIALSGCLGGEVPRALRAGAPERAERAIREYQSIFGPDNFYLELGAHTEHPEQRLVNDALVALADRTGAQLVATGDIHYVEKSDAEAQDILVSVQSGNRFDDENRLTMKEFDLSMRSPDEMAALFARHPEAITNTEVIKERVNVSIELGKNRLPRFAVPEGYDPDSYLAELSRQGVVRRFGSEGLRALHITDRLNYELAVIRQTGFAPYFLIVQDFVSWAKQQGIVVGPGRGSAAGSLVSYVLGITNVDPLTYHLLFDRFLNKDRISMPDIDLDFADTRRDEVIEYVAKKYGRAHVAQIITFGTMAARAAVRDTGRALGMPYSFCDQIAKLIPFTPGVKTGWLLKCLSNVQELKDLYERDPEAKRLLDAAMKLEGVARHASTHACGVVISPEPLATIVPLQHATRGGTGRNENDNEKSKAVVTQYEMHAIEDLGLLKMDFLGLRNLTIIEHALAIIRSAHGIAIDVDKIPLDDKKTFVLFQRGETSGLFQFESAGMKRYLKELKPTEFEDLIAMVSLYRPGPMELIPSYINRKHGKERVTYLHPKLEPILNKTYGIGIYQEQMMEIAKELAGYSLPEADTLRKAIGKKIKSLLDQQREKLIAGMLKNNIDRKTASAVWELFPPFARYGFNRCLAGDTLIYDPTTGIPTPIRALHEQRMPRRIVSLEKNWRLHPKPVADVTYNGRKKVYRIQTRSGRIISATINHPFLTPSGWKAISNILPREKIAVPRILPEPNRPKTESPHRLGLLGYLLAEGNFCHPNGFYFYSTQQDEIDDYCAMLQRFENTTPTIDRSKRTIAVYAKRRDLKRPTEAVQWIESLGLKYKKATQKFFPEFVYRLPNHDLAILIGKMFQGDGCINLKRKDPQIFYATSSAAIARGLQHLFLRFEILSTVHTKSFRYRGGKKIGYTVTLYRHDNIQKFLTAFGRHFVGNKAVVAAQIITTHPILNGTLRPWAARGSYDTVPVALIRNVMRETVHAQHESHASFARKIGVSERLFLSDKRKIGYLRETAGVIARALHDTTLLAMAESDVYWDEIKSITPLGVTDTYDLTVDETHNFVANDIIVHNSHAACYALIAYQTGYLKAHYPAEFLTALLMAEGNDVERIAFIVEEARAMNIEVLAPDINESDEKFAMVGPRKIRFGLASVKNVGANIVSAIASERVRAGPFGTLAEFLERVQHKDLNKKSLESLIKCGALDGLGERATLLVNLDLLLDYNREAQKSAVAKQESLFAVAPGVVTPQIRLRPTDPAPKRERLQWERELLGLYVSDHPVKEYMARFAERKATPIRDLAGNPNRTVIIGGLVAGIQKIVTKTGEPMLFVKMEDLTARTEILVFPRVLAENPGIWQEEKIVLLRGRVSDKDGTTKVLCEKAVEMV